MIKFCHVSRSQSFVSHISRFISLSLKHIKFRIMWSFIVSFEYRNVLIGASGRCRVSMSECIVCLGVWFYIVRCVICDFISYSCVIAYTNFWVQIRASNVNKYNVMHKYIIPTVFYFLIRNIFILRGYEKFFLIST